MKSEQDFLARLEQEAARQAQLHEQRLLPTQLDWLSSFIGRFPWQVVLGAAGITAAILRGVR